MKLGKASPRKPATCAKCGNAKRPTCAYLKLLKSRGLPYICQACREPILEGVN